MASVSTTQFYAPMVGAENIPIVRDEDAGTEQPFVLGFHITGNSDESFEWVSPWKLGDYGGPNSPVQPGSYNKFQPEGRKGNAQTLIELLMSAHAVDDDTPLCEVVIAAFRAPSGIQATLGREFSATNQPPANGQSGYDLSQGSPRYIGSYENVAQNGPMGIGAYLAALGTDTPPSPLPSDFYEMPMTASPAALSGTIQNFGLGHLPQGYNNSLMSFLNKSELLGGSFGIPLPNLSITQEEMGAQGIHFAVWGGVFGSDINAKENDDFAGSFILGADFTHSVTR